MVDNVLVLRCQGKQKNQIMKKILMTLIAVYCWKLNEYLNFFAVHLLGVNSIRSGLLQSFRSLN